VHIAIGRLTRLARFVAAIGTAALLLHGCGGGGSDGAPGPAGPAGTAGTAGATGPAGPAGAPAVVTTNAAQLSPAQFAAAQLNASVTGVTIASPPVVTFKVTDQNGTPVTGLGFATQAANATVPRYQNISFTLAKLVPGTPGIAPGVVGPARWVSYIVTTVPTTTAAATGTRPSSDNTGTLVDNGDGTYKYTFYRDITKVKDQVAAMTGLAGVAADLGDLTYDANAVHRLGIQISGNAPGTGTNTKNEQQATPGVALAKPVNVVYDFIPATGKQLAATDAGERMVVDTASCNECHGKLGGIPGTESSGFHGGSRYNPQYCDTCHTDQQKYGQARVSSTNGVFPAGNTNVADGVTLGDFPVLIHRVHAGETLVKQGYTFSGVKLNDTLFPQDIRNCTKCHDSSGSKVAPQGNNFKTVPSRLACGTCHDGINFATGQGVTLQAANDAKVNGGTPAATGHVGGAQADDGKCALCHDATSIASVYHVPTTRPNPDNVLNGGANANTNAAWIASKADNLPQGAVAVSYDLKSVSRDANKHPVLVFRMLQNGTAVPFNTFGGGKTELWDGFIGAPSAYFVYAVPQDGINLPSDFNGSASGYLKNIWNGSAAGTLAGPDGSGYYTVTLTGVVVPDSATMLTGGLGYSYGLPATQPLTQVNLGGKFAYNATNKTGGLITIAKDAQKVATGYGARRAIVDDNRCNSCHQELGAFTLEAFHAGQRNDGTTCAWCHNPNRTSSGWSADSTSFIHAIHGGSKRTVPFTWHAPAVGQSYQEVGYPGILNQCETCHVPGSYDFSGQLNASQEGNRLYRAVATGTVVSAGSDALTKYTVSPYVTADVNYGSGASVASATGVLTAAAGTTLVNSPTAAACFSCHDTSDDKAHMKANGGSIYAPRAQALQTTESCLVCHGSGKVADIKAVHTK
jgi:OmcA/MtrC family decaheme c-type cytochrome